MCVERQTLALYDATIGRSLRPPASRISNFVTMPVRHLGKESKSAPTKLSGLDSPMKRGPRAHPAPTNITEFNSATDCGICMEELATTGAPVPLTCCLNLQAMSTTRSHN